MRTLWLLVLMLVAGICVLASSASADDIDFYQSISDEIGDVEDSYGGQNESNAGVDIVSIEVDKEEDMVRFKMLLAEAYAPDANYRIEYSFDDMYDGVVLLEDGNHTGHDTKSGFHNVTGEITAEDRVIFWYVPVEEMAVVSEFHATFAYAERTAPDHNYIWDQCSYEYPHFGDTGPVDLTVKYELRNLTYLKRTIRLRLEDNDSLAFRAELDADGDGTIRLGEIEAYETTNAAPLSPWNYTDISLNDIEGTIVYHRFETNLVRGRADYDGLVLMDSVTTISFVKPRDEPYEYCWHTEFFNHMIMPGMRADNRSWLTLSLGHEGHSALKFSKDQLSPTLQGFLEANDTRFRMEGEEMATHWETTMMNWEGFTLYVKDPDPPDPPDEENGGDDGCELTFAIIAIPMAFIMLTGYNRRSDRSRG